MMDFLYHNNYLQQQQNLQPPEQSTKLIKNWTYKTNKYHTNTSGL